MTLIFKIIYHLVLLFIAIWLLLFVLISIFNLSFQNPNHQDTFEELLFAIPIAIAFTSFRAGFKSKWDYAKKRSFIVTRIFVGVALLIFVFLYAIASLGSGMCAWSTHQVLFTKKSDSSTKIVERDFGCGATDSSSPVFTTFQSKEITPLFVHYTKIDTSKINMNDWYRAKEQ
jgi:hypothetical protein